MSDSCVSCTVPATWNASLQIPSNVPPLPTFLKLLQNHHVLLTFGRVQKPLRLPHKTTLQRPKVLRGTGVLHILTWKRASRHNCVHFLNISTSKSAPRMVCFVHFWLRNVLRATTACTFSTCQHPKVVRTCGAFRILTSKCFAPQRRAIVPLSSPLRAPHPPL